MQTLINRDEHTYEASNIHICERCDVRYDWRKSPSTLKMTFCGSLCEQGALGFTIEALLKLEVQKGSPAPLLEIEKVASLA